MWDNIWEWILRRVVNLREEELGFSKYDNSEKIKEWTEIYEGKAHWVNYSSELGEYITAESNTGAAIASELARLTTIELESTVSGGAEADYVNEQYQRVVESLRLPTEYAIAKGGMIMKPYISGDKILVEFIQNGDFIPIKFNDANELVSVAFVETIARDKNVYNRVELHELKPDKTYTITNKVYMGNSLKLEKGTEVPLSTVPEWKDLEREVELNNLDNPLYGYFRPPFSNLDNSSSNLGVSVFSKVEKLIERLDRQNSLLVHEYKATRAKILLDRVFTMNLPEGEKWSFVNSDIYELLDVSQAAGTTEAFYKVYGPAIRQAEIMAGINKYQRDIEFNVGLTYGTLSNVSDTEKTAEEVRFSKQRSYSTVSDIQKSLENALIDLVSAMISLTSLYNLASVDKVNGDILVDSDNVEYEVAFNFDDSIVVDAKSNLEEVVQGIEKGLVHPKRYLMLKYGMTEEQALEELAEIKEFNSTDEKAVSAPVTNQVQDPNAIDQETNE